MRLFIKSLIIGPLMGLVAVSACTPQQALDAGRYQAQIAGACQVAMTLAPIAGPYSIYIIGACATEEAIAKLALDPSSLTWLQGIVARLRQR